MDSAFATPQTYPRRILIRGVNWLGDAVMTMPALQRLRERFPDARIALLTPAKLADLWHGYRNVDAVVGFSPGQSPWSVARELRPLQADTSLVLPNSQRAALEVWLARIPQRIGYARPWRNWFLTRAIPTRPGQVRMRKRQLREIKRRIRTGERANIPHKGISRPADSEDTRPHHVHDYLGLAATLGASAEPVAPQLEVSAHELEEAEQIIRSCRRDMAVPLVSWRFLLGINPGAEYGPAKRWPIAHFADVAREVCRRNPDCLWLIFGGPNDQAQCAQLEAALGIHGVNLAGKTSLRQLMALLKRSRVLLTNDTGPMHVAAALGTPVVALFGSTTPELTGPGLPGDPRHILLTSSAACSPCFRRTCPIDLRCLTDISVQKVLEALFPFTNPR